MTDKGKQQHPRRLIPESIVLWIGVDGQAETYMEFGDDAPVRYVPESALSAARAEGRRCGRIAAYEEVLEAIQPYDNRESIVTWLTIRIDIAKGAQASPPVGAEEGGGEDG